MELMKRAPFLFRFGIPSKRRQGESIPPDKLFCSAEPAFIVWILLKVVLNFVQQTPPKEKRVRGLSFFLTGMLGRS